MNVNTITAYTFNAATKTVTLTNVGTAKVEQLKSIVNITRGVVYYDPEDASLGATAATNVITLEVSTTGHADADKLEILYELLPDTTTQPVSVASLPLPTDASTEGTLVQLKDIAETIDQTARDISTEVAGINNKTTADPSTATLQNTANTIAQNIKNDMAEVVLSLAIMDEWDDTDRCKVSPIPNQQGVAGGPGVTSATTQRVVLASDHPSVPVTQSTKATYMAATATFTPAASATDIWTIVGSGTKTVRVVRIILSGTQTTAGNIGTVSLVKRSTANTGGTAVAATKVPLDSASASATATVQHYTANPTLGTTVGTMFNPRVTVVAPATAAAFAPVFDYNAQDMHLGEHITLRGTSEALSVNLGGSTPSGAANFTVTCIWTEE